MVRSPELMTPRNHWLHLICGFITLFTKKYPLNDKYLTISGNFYIKI